MIVQVRGWQIEKEELIRLFRAFIPYRRLYGLELGFEKFFEDNQQFCLASGLDAVEDTLLHNWIGKHRWENGRWTRYVKREHTKQEWEAKIKEHNGKCAYCGVVLVKVTLDHIIPVSKGGTDKIENIVPACWRCNFSKRDKEVVGWLAQCGKK